MSKEDKLTVLEGIKKCGDECLLLVFEAKRSEYKSYIANLIFSSNYIVQKSKVDWEYKSFATVIEEEFVRYEFADRWFLDKEGEKNHSQWHTNAMECFSNMIREKVWQVAEEGLIFYVKDNDTFRPAKFSDDSYNFVSQLITDELVNSFTFNQPPSWVNQLYLSRHNFDAYSLIWLNPMDKCFGFYAPTRQEKCEAVWRETERLGVNLSSITSEKSAETKVASLNRWPWGGYTNRNLDHLEAAAQQFWVLYDPSDPTTAPTNARVIEWLNTKRGVTPATAEKIASILRDEKLPTGPRK